MIAYKTALFPLPFSLTGPTSGPQTCNNPDNSVELSYMFCSDVSYGLQASWLPKKHNHGGWKYRTFENSSGDKRKSGLCAWGANSPQSFDGILSIPEWTGCLILLVPNFCQRKRRFIFKALNYRKQVSKWKMSIPDNGIKLTQNTAE